MKDIILKKGHRTDCLAVEEAGWEMRLRELVREVPAWRVADDAVVLLTKRATLTIDKLESFISSELERQRGELRKAVEGADCNSTSCCDEDCVEQFLRAFDAESDRLK